MRVIHRASLLAAALCACENPLQAQTVEPTGKWVVDYATTQCSASREFREADSPVVFGIIPMPNEQGYDLIIAADGFGPNPPVEMAGLYGYGGFAEAPSKTWVINFRTGSKQSGYRFHLTAEEMGKARSATSIWLRVPQKKFVMTIPLSAVGGVLGALHDCVADLQRYWNTDGEKDGRITVSAKGDLRSIFSWKDYPDEAATRHQEGSAQYLLLVDETGKVAGCQLVQASGIPAIDMMGCQVIRERAKFTPAVDGHGKAVRSTVVTPPVSFRMEP